jgi:hypothetical protein
LFGENNFLDIPKAMPYRIVLKFEKDNGDTCAKKSTCKKQKTLLERVIKNPFVKFYQPKPININSE